MHFLLRWRLKRLNTNEDCCQCLLWSKDSILAGKARWKWKIDQMRTMLNVSWYFRLGSNWMKIQRKVGRYGIHEKSSLDKLHLSKLRCFWWCWLNVHWWFYWFYLMLGCQYLLRRNSCNKWIYHQTWGTWRWPNHKHFSRPSTTKQTYRSFKRQLHKNHWVWNGKMKRT